MELQQDAWSLTRPRFGEEGQLEVVGWTGRNTNGNKFYVLKCSVCETDGELFVDGYFKSVKSNLTDGQVPCGCSKSTRWSKEQYKVLCSRKAGKLGYKFLGFVGVWRGKETKIEMLCEKHGTWKSGNITGLINEGKGCPGCRCKAASTNKTKPDHVMVASFFASGAFNPDTKFWRSSRKTNQGNPVFWFMQCPECGETGEAVSAHLQKGQRPCACSKHCQQECYINLIRDEHKTTIAVKFGIARNSKQRIKQQISKSTYALKQHSVYTFPSVEQCKKAERECKQELECGVVLKRDFPDGYTETTWVYNLEKIEEIYKRNGGVKVR